MGQASFVSIQISQQRRHRRRQKQKREQRAASGQQRKKKQFGERDATSDQCQTQRIRSLSTPVSDSIEFKAGSIIETISLCHKTGGGQGRTECNRHKANAIGETFYRLETSTGHEAFRVSQSVSRQATDDRTRVTKPVNKQPTDEVRLRVCQTSKLNGIKDFHLKDRQQFKEQRPDDDNNQKLEFNKELRKHIQRLHKKRKR